MANDAGALVVCDVVSSLGAVPFAFDDWGIDVAIGGSQKALSASPGIAFAAISERAWEASRTATNPRFYFDWATYKHVRRPPASGEPVDAGDQRDAGTAGGARRSTSRTAWTRRWRAIGRLSEAVKEGAKALGLDLFGEGLEDNWTVTAIRAPEAADADTISDTMRSDFGCVIAPGQGPLKGKVFRIGHFGYFSELDIIRGLAALEMTLARARAPGEARGGRRRGRDGLRSKPRGPLSRAGPGHRDSSPRPGLELLRKDFQVDVRPDLATGDLAAEIAPYDALIIRSAHAGDAPTCWRRPPTSRSWRAPASDSTTSTSRRRPAAASWS